MNPLGEELPTAVGIGGEPYPVRADWRSCMRIILAFEDPELTRQEQQEILLKLLYKKMPPLCGEALTQGVKFLNCGEQGEQREATAAGGRLYSFQRDAKFIYAAFRQSHGIDLATAQLHWWAFCWLFLDLREDCTFCRLVGLRERKRRGKLTREEREQLAGMEQLLELPGRHSAEEEQQLADFLQQLAGQCPR